MIRNLALKATCTLLFALTPAFAQITTLNLKTQGRNANFSNLAITLPVTVDSALPNTCQLGQLFFNTSAAPGYNLFGCTSTNNWTMLSGAGGSSTPSGSSSLSSSSLAFANQTINLTSPTQAILLSNVATSSLFLGGIAVNGTNSADFSESSNCGSTLAAGASCTIAIAFTPSVLAAETATLSVVDSAVGSPHTVALSGTGVAAAQSTGPVLTPAAPSTSAGTPLTITANKAVTWSLAPGSSGSISVSGSSVTYTPPASVPAQNALGGCMVVPNDSVFNTRIDNLPVNSNSATWMGSFIAPVTLLPSWGTNILDNTVPQTQQFFNYTTLSNGNFQIAAWPKRKREGGAFTVDGNSDHHMASVNHQTCQFYETYQEGVPNPTCKTCTAASGWKYTSTSYALPSSSPYGGGSTDAAGLPLLPLTLHLSEVKAGQINHALRFTLCTGCINSATYLWPATAPNGSATPTAPPMGARFRLKSSFIPSGVFAVNISSSGSGYTAAPQVTFAGCQVSPSAAAAVSGGSITSITLISMGSGCVNPTVAIGGPGTGAAATATVFSSTAQVVLTGLKQYGMFLADNGMSGQIETDSDVNQDATVAAALNEIGSARLGAAYFEVVEESSLISSAASHQARPNNGYVSPAMYATLTATDSSGNSTTTPIALQSILVGVPYTKMTILAGMSGYQLTSWVNGSANQTVTWRISSGVGSITSAGLYTPPASLASPASAVLTATAAADPNATTNVYLSVIPGGSNPSNSIRLEVGNPSNYTDSQNNVWLADNLGFETAGYSQQNDNYPSGLWGSIADPTIYQTYIYNWGDDITYGPYIVPNGNYKVGFLMGRGGCSGTFSESTIYGNGLIWGPVDLESQGQIGARFDLGKAVNYACRTPYTAYVPAQVTNNVLYATMRVVGGNNSHTSPIMNALSILPDSSASHLAIDTQQTTSVKAGSAIQLYSVGWYMSGAVTWSVSGGGSIDQTGLYTAPASVSSTQTVTVTATSTSTPTISATATLTITP